MTTFVIRHDVFALDVSFSEDAMSISLDDGRTMTVPLAWYPRLLHAKREELENFELIGSGEGLHWPDLDEDISIEGVLDGRRSSESSDSLARWKEHRAKT